MKDIDYSKAKKVGILVNGKNIEGLYVVNRRMITVTSNFGTKTTQLGGSPANAFARLLLSELIHASV